MSVTIKELIGLTKELLGECLRCGSLRVVRNGKQNGRQFYLCRECGKAFVETSSSAIAHSHSSKTVWKQVIRDTIDGISIDKTASALDLTHTTVFHMRHKILYCVEQAVLNTPSMLEGICEADETYVLESVKGREIFEDYHRKPRKHGAKASNRFIG